MTILCVGNRYLTSCSLTEKGFALPRLLRRVTVEKAWQAGACVGALISLPQSGRARQEVEPGYHTQGAPPVPISSTEAPHPKGSTTFLDSATLPSPRVQRHAPIKGSISHSSAAPPQTAEEFPQRRKSLQIVNNKEITLPSQSISLTKKSLRDAVSRSSESTRN